MVKHKMPHTLHFKTKKGYHKWLAFGHIHRVFKRRKGEKIVIRGRKHKVM